MKKTSTNNRRKKLPLLLGALLIISVAAYGTRAYFSDSATVQGDIQLSLGNVDITTSNDANWEYTPIEGMDTRAEDNLDLDSSTSDTTGQKYTNVRPGDSFTRSYTITNIGSLESKVNLSTTKYDLSVLENDSVDDGAFTVSIENLENEFILDAKDGEDSSKTFKVTIKVDLDAKDSISYNNANKETVNYLEQAISVKAVQTNAK
ncbi:M73 family metallopeptidase [Carnobacterium sp. ISL-102]|uniref:M73 family metallopeptidase n=1 Tax=Carnobacterium sp. ISL-102 TaxID=2819142 RepID=UPI001BECC13D|nr:M73 family metallopeptidase [Carnobacterium sp. ISL-102]MBT2731133.1 hypothetical protein [Carnobacterium sp. ISL-102]